MQYQPSGIDTCSSGNRMETGNLAGGPEEANFDSTETRGSGGSGEEGEEDGEDTVEAEVCFIHSSSLLQSADRNPRYTGRVQLVYSLIEAYGLLDKMKIVAPSVATRRQLQAFHSSDYVHFLETHGNQSDSEEDEEEAEDRDSYGLGYDCPLFTGCYDYVCAVGGAGLTSADLLLSGEAKVVVNWYGGWHHAKRDAAAGFCYCNDIVLAALRLLSQFSRVLYVDIDVHHGDGVEEAFWLSPKVMTVSVHQFSPGFFPGSGDVTSVGGGRGKFHTINVPLREGAQDEQYYSVFTSVLSEVKGRFQPQCVLLQCGADMLSGDPLGEFSLTPRGAGRCVGYILHWSLPTLLMGGGGYNFPNTARFWTHCTALAVGQQLTNEIPEHKFFPEYGPSFQLAVSAGNRTDQNSPDHVAHLLHTISNHLSHLTPPSASP